MKKESEIKKSERRKMIVAMEYILRNLNDEELFEEWLLDGVADGDIEYGNFDTEAVDNYYISSRTFARLMGMFLNMMHFASSYGDNTGLYCGDVLSKGGK